MAASVPVPPGAVRLWLGYKSTALTYPQFYAELGSTFVPSCATLEPRLGLTAYYSALPTLRGATSDVPDQTALMFWADTKAHGQAKATLAERAYLDLHQIVYDVASCRSLTPIALSGAPKPGQAYYLIGQKTDWMLGGARHLVGKRPAKISAKAFAQQVASWTQSYAKTPTPGADGALLYMTADLLIFWEHWSKRKPPATQFDALSALVKSFLSQEAQDVSVPGDLWKKWPGLKLKVPGCLNLQFPRPARST